MIVLAQSLQPTPAQVWSLVVLVLFVAGGVALYYRIKADRRKANESHEPKRTILPMPLVTKAEDPPVLMSAFVAQNERRDKELIDMEQRIERRIDAHEGLVRERLHKLSGEVNNATLEAKNGREIATEQFQNIEGRLGELKSTTEHTNALAIRTDQRVAKIAEDLPDKIAAALNRGRRT